MQKKIVVVLLSMALCLSFVGCAKNSTTGKSGSEASTVGATAGESTQEVSYLKSSDKQAETTLSNGTIDVSLFDDIQKVYDKLGEPTNTDQFGNYVYDDFKIQCFDNGDSKELVGILSSSKNVKTSKGISVGASYDDVIAAYGKPSFESDEEDGNTLNYSYQEYTLGFTMKNGIVDIIAVTKGQG